MPIHAVDLACSADVNAALVGGTGAYVSTWLTSYVAWEPDGDLTQTTEPPRLVESDPDGDSSTQYYRGGPWRFAWTEDKSILLDNLVGQFEAYRPTWWRIRWHECDHDEDGRDGCQWDDKYSGGQIPSGVA